MQRRNLKTEVRTRLFPTLDPGTSSKLPLCYGMLTQYPWALHLRGLDSLHGQCTVLYPVKSITVLLNASWPLPVVRCWAKSEASPGRSTRMVASSHLLTDSLVGREVLPGHRISSLCIHHPQGRMGEITTKYITLRADYHL